MSGNRVEYEYHWGRIFAALLIVIVLLASVIYWFSRPKHNDFNDASTSLPTPVKQTPDSAHTLSKPLSHQTSETEEAKQPHHSDSATQPLEQIEQTPHVTQTNTIDTQTGDKNPSNSTNTETETASAVLMRHVKEMKVTLHSKHVKRFVLTQGIKNKEPLGEQSNAFKADKNGLITLYAFSEVAGLKDQHLEYRWIYQGKKVAKVNVGVWGDKWRSSSSKFVNRTMLGSWRLELHSGQKLLANMTFTVE